MSASKEPTTNPDSILIEIIRVYQEVTDELTSMLGLVHDSLNVTGNDELIRGEINNVTIRVKDKMNLINNLLSMIKEEVVQDLRKKVRVVH